MTAVEFGKIYDDLRCLSMDSEVLKKLNKQELVDKLRTALLALKSAEKTIFSQCDTLVSVTNRLLNHDQNAPTSLDDKIKPKVYGDQPSTILLKPKFEVKEDERPVINTKFSDALKKVNVKNARVSGNGYLIVNVPDKVSHEKATNSLRDVFAENFSFEAPKRLLPKLTLAGVPRSIDDSRVIQCICDKDENIFEMVNSGEICEVIKSTEMRGRPGENSLYKSVVLKCSAKVRNYVMNSNGGYIYIELVRCKAYDRFFVPQCYHCSALNHIAKNCPNKDRPPTCPKCSGDHSVKFCKSQIEKCVNCQKLNPNKGNDHTSFSHHCPLIVREKRLLCQKTDFSCEKVQCHIKK